MRDFWRSAARTTKTSTPSRWATRTKPPACSPRERTLLLYVKKLTQEPWKIRDTDVERLRGAGWTDPQIYEATFDIALFAFFNRMANAYGLDPDPTGWRPPDAPPKKPDAA